tara:strand:- start:5058 stop:5927 length:870 start_codon:yes stop_codon:yes gene_type:complete
MTQNTHGTVDTLYQVQIFTPPGGFTNGIEGPAVHPNGNLYCVNFHHEGTIGEVTPDGSCSIFVELPNGSIGNGIRFHSDGKMLIADYTNHNVLAVDMVTREIIIFAHNNEMHQPNDICITRTDAVFASDPCWADDTGKIWVTRGEDFELVESHMGTTNGIEISPCEKFLYVNESIQKRIWKYDLKGTKLSNKKLLIEFPDFGLDGMRCDSEGFLYSTRYGKGTIVKLDPHSGEVLHEITLTGKNCSNVAFGGPDGKRIYVMLQDTGNIETFLVEHPGRAFVIHQERGLI